MAINTTEILQIAVRSEDSFCHSRCFSSLSLHKPPKTACSEGWTVAAGLRVVATLDYAEISFKELSTCLSLYDSDAGSPPTILPANLHKRLPRKFSSEISMKEMVKIQPR